MLAIPASLLPHIFQAPGDEPKTLDEHSRDNTSHGNKEWVERNNARSSMRREITMSSQNRNADNIVNAVQPPMGCQDQIDKQTQSVKLQNMEKATGETKED